MYNMIQRFKRLLGYGSVGAALALGAGMNTTVLDHIKDFEGFRGTAYHDIVGVGTLGYGHTNSAGTVQFHMGETWTKEYASEVLESDLEKFADAIDRQVTVALTDCQRAILTSWAYNVGPTATGKSTLVRKLNAGEYNSVPAQLMRWNRAGGTIVRGLTRRRGAEAELWRNNCEEK